MSPLKIQSDEIHLWLLDSTSVACECLRNLGMEDQKISPHPNSNWYEETTLYCHSASRQTQFLGSTIDSL